MNTTHRHIDHSRDCIRRRHNLENANLRAMGPQKETANYRLNEMTEKQLNESDLLSLIHALEEEKFYAAPWQLSSLKHALDALTAIAHAKNSRGTR